MSSGDWPSIRTSHVDRPPRGFTAVRVNIAYGRMKGRVELSAFFNTSLSIEESGVVVE